MEPSLIESYRLTIAWGDSLEEALELACGHMEWGQGCPKAMWRQGVLVMNLNQIAKESMQRHDSKLSHLKPNDQKA